MDFSYLENILKNNIQKSCTQLNKEIINKFVSFIFWDAPWVKYGNNQSLYILGLAKGKYDFYYFGCDDNYEIKLISCALQIEKDKQRKNDYIPKIDEDFKKWSKESKVVWKIIKNNIKEYFKENKQDKLIYFQDHILSDEHIEKI